MVRKDSIGRVAANHQATFGSVGTASVQVGSCCAHCAATANLRNPATTGGACGQRSANSKEAGETNPPAQARSPVPGGAFGDRPARLASHSGAREVLVLGLA